MITIGPANSLSNLLWRGLVICLMLTASIATAQDDYVIGPQDVLAITVWDQTDLSGSYTVDADGTFNFPLIGRIVGSGQTVRELEAALKERLKDGYFKNPQLSVAVEEYRSQRIVIVGEVREPGTYPLTGHMTLVEALARAGSTMPDAMGSAVIVRGAAGAALPSTAGQPAASEIVQVNLADLQNGSLSNVELRAGDTIFVPRTDTVYLIGEVRSPGAYPAPKGATVLQALSLAGGVSDRGSASRVRIVRLIGGKKTELKASLDDPIQAGDTIMVLKRFF